MICYSSCEKCRLNKNVYKEDVVECPDKEKLKETIERISDEFKFSNFQISIHCKDWESKY